MPRPQSPASDGGDDSNDMMMQEELDRLRNQLLLLEGDRQALIQETNVDIRRQKEEMRRLETDNEELKTWMSLVESGQNKRKDNEVLAALCDLRDDYDSLIVKIDGERQKSQTLDADIRKMEKECKKKEKCRGGKDKGSSGRRFILQKKTRVMENRLDNRLKKYGATLESNRQLREDISKLSNERNIFDNVYKKCERQLEQYRQEIQELTEQTIQAYEQRDEANNKILALKEKNDKDEAQFEHEKRDLQRIIDHDKKLREFMNTKANDRIEWKKMEEERRRRHGSAGERARMQQERQIKTYDDAMVRIKEITQEEDLDRIISEFIEKEDTNFALFQYVRELNNQAENLNDDIERIRQNIEHFQSEEVRTERERQNIIRRIEEETNLVTGEADKAEVRLTEVKKIMDQLTVAVASVFDKIKCDPSALKEMLGRDDSVTEDNIMQYLGSVEQKTNELLKVQLSLQVKSYRDSTREEPPNYGLTLGLHKASKTQRENSMEPPAIGDDFGDDDEEADELRPYSQSELRQRITHWSAKRTGSGHARGVRSFEKSRKK